MPSHGYLRNTKQVFSLHLPCCLTVDLRRENRRRRKGGGHFGVSGYLLYGSIPLWFYDSDTMVLTDREDQERGEGRFFACRTICRSSSRNKAAAKCVPGYFQQQQQATPQWEENETSSCQKQETRSKPTPEEE